MNALSLRLVLIFSLPFLVGCGLLSDALGLAAILDTPTPEIQEITVYSAFSDAQLDYYLPYFEREHPEIKVNLERGSTWDITRKILAQKGDVQADVIWGLAASAMIRLQVEGILEPYVPSTPQAENQLRQVANTLRDPAAQPDWVGLNIYMTAFCINPDQLTKELLPMPTSWLDLLDPIYRGRIIMPDPQHSGTGYMAVAGLIQLFNNQDPSGDPLLKRANEQQLTGETAAWAYLDALDKNVLQYTVSDRDPCTRVIDGEVPIGITYDAVAIDEARRGNPILAVFPQEGSGWDIESAALIKHNPVKPAARIFADWALSETAMRAYHHYYPIVATGTEGEPLIGYVSDPIEQMLPNRLVWSSANYERIVTQWLNRYESKAESGSIERLPSGVQPTPIHTPGP